MKKTRKFVSFITVLFTAVFAFSGMGIAGKADDTLNVALKLEITNLDSYYETAGSVHVIKPHIWDGLLYVDPISLEVKPSLAKSYKFIDNLTLEFELEENVTFHDGTGFDADDVVYTLNWVADPANKVKQKNAVKWIKSAEKINQFKVRVHFKEPTPVALQFFASYLMIYPEGIYANGTSVMNETPVGTGPYMVKSLTPGKEYILEKFDGYFKNSPKGVPAIKNINIRIISETTTQIAEVMSGGLDWIYKVPTEQVENLGQRKNLSVDSNATMRISYMLMDSAGRSDDNSPLKNLKVRQAISHAIDRQGIVNALVGGNSKVIHAFCFPTNFGCPDDVTQYEYNPEKAKKLLAEAGYPNGFTTKLAAWRDRPYVEAMQNNLAAIGIKAELVYMKLASLKKLWFSGELPLVYGSWGGGGINDVGNIVPLFFTKSTRDLAQDDEVADWINSAGLSADPSVREQHYFNALRKIAKEAFVLPMFSDNMNYVFTKDLKFAPSATGNPHFYLSQWK